MIPYVYSVTHRPGSIQKRNVKTRDKSATRIHATQHREKKINTQKTLTTSKHHKAQSDADAHRTDFQEPQKGKNPSA